MGDGTGRGTLFGPYTEDWRKPVEASEEEPEAEDKRRDATVKTKPRRAEGAKPREVAEEPDASAEQE